MRRTVQTKATAFAIKNTDTSMTISIPNESTTQKSAAHAFRYMATMMERLLLPASYGICPPEMRLLWGCIEIVVEFEKGTDDEITRWRAAAEAAAHQMGIV